MNQPVNSQLLEAGRNASSSVAIYVGRPVFSYPVNNEHQDVWAGIADTCLGFRGVALKDLAVKGVVADGKNDALCVGGPCLAYVVGDATNGKVGTWLAPYGGSSGLFRVSTVPTGIYLAEDNSANTNTNLKWIYIKPYALRNHYIWRNAAASTDNNIAASQSPAAAALTINGTLASGGVATLLEARNVIITSGGNDSGITFAVVGTDIYGQALTETITGANVGVATGNKAFKTVTSVTPSGSAAGTVKVGTGVKFGLPGCRNARKVEYAFRGGTLEGTLPTIANSVSEIASNTCSFNSAPNGTQLDAVLLER